MKKYYFLTIQKVLLIVCIIILIGMVALDPLLIFGKVSFIAFGTMHIAGLLILFLFQCSVDRFSEAQLIDRKWATNRFNKSPYMIRGGFLLMMGECIHIYVMANGNIILGYMIFIVFIAMVTTLTIRTIKVFLIPPPLRD